MPLPTDMPHDPDCIFCKIVAGEIPCHRLAEDDHTLAFLDIQPLSRGHLLVIPKAHYELLHEMPPELVAAVARMAHAMGDRLVKRLAVSDYNLLQNNGAAAGQAVGHVHMHLIPRVDNDGLGYRWNAGSLNQAEADELLARLAD